MKTELFDKIIEFLKKKNIDYELTIHEPVYTSDQASEISGHVNEEGTKSLALSSEKYFIVVTVSGNERVNFRAIKKFLGVKKLGMCQEESLKTNLKTEIGGLAPFGYGSDIIILVSISLFNQNKVYFNPGRNDATIAVRGEIFKDIMTACGAKIINHNLEE